MLVCCKCKREMLCDKIGVGADFGHGHVYEGDRFKCPGCNDMILKTNGTANKDPEYKFHDEYVRMIQGPVAARGATDG